ncbi:rCG34097 [Rattus norvegicus]|uniref:RCG34097 n=1 Tax=Rattus norvegicus TaxID=10116 RepID=A6HEQ3_RAT|nr:rCG34097 [Rattus norvegicus]
MRVFLSCENWAQSFLLPLPSPWLEERVGAGENLGAL